VTWNPRITFAALLVVCVVAVYGTLILAGSDREDRDSTAIAATTGVKVAAAGDIAGEGGNGARQTGDLIRSQNPDVVLALGDLAYTAGTFSQFMNQYDPTWGSFKDITLPVPGNHEWKTPNAAGFAQYFGTEKPYYWSSNVGGWRIIGVDSECSKVGGCTPGSPEYQFIQQALSGAPKCTLALWHRPYWNTGKHGSYSAIRPIVQLLQAQHADVILTGHDHNYQRFPKTGGVREFVVGTGGAGLYSFVSSTSAGLRP